MKTNWVVNKLRKMLDPEAFNEVSVVEWNGYIKQWQTIGVMPEFEVKEFVKRRIGMSETTYDPKKQAEMVAKMHEAEEKAKVYAVEGAKCRLQAQMLNTEADRLEALAYDYAEKAADLEVETSYEKPLHLRRRRSSRISYSNYGKNYVNVDDEDGDDPS